jgi:hypothetical protein
LRFRDVKADGLESKMMKLRVSIVLFVLCGTMSAFAQDREKPWWGLDLGVFRPTSGEISDKFGDNLFRVGFRPFTNRISEKWKLIYDFSVITASDDGERMLVIPLTVGFTRSFGDPEGDMIPFVQFGAGPAYYDYSLTRTTLGPVTERFKTRRVGANANLELGVLISKRFALVGRGDWFTEADGFDFSGISLTLSWAILRF